MEYKRTLIGEKAFSVNKMATRDARFKTQEFKDWHLRLTTLLQDDKGLYDLAANHRNYGGTFSFCVVVHYPEHIFYNKQGDINSKTFDVSNIEKPLIDLIFGDIMGVNDKNITTLYSTKRASTQYSIEIAIIHYEKELK